MTKRPPQRSGTHAERIRNERGADGHEPPEARLLSPSEMLDALRHEVIAISKGAELRIREITAVATDYAKGEITAQQANARFKRYSERWEDTLYAISSVEGRTDKDILREIDEVHPEYTSPAPYNATAGKAGGRPR